MKSRQIRQPARRMRKYTSTQHRFFNYLVAFLGSLCSIELGLVAQKLGNVRSCDQNFKSGIQGKPNVSGLELIFYPHDLMQTLVDGNFPEEIELYEHPYKSPNGSTPILIRGTKRLISSLIESAFVHYFESVRPKVEYKYGRNTQLWPAVWNFGRVVRNAIAHGGIINFKNPNAPAVTWLTLTYSPADNGRQIIFHDLTPVEMILLMEDMDAAV